MQRKLLTADLAEITTYESRLTEISGEISDILENLDEDDKSSTDAVSEDGDSFVATELKKAVKSIGKNPETDFDRALVMRSVRLKKASRISVHRLMRRLGPLLKD